MKNNYLLGVIAGLCSALLWGAQSPIAKIISASGLNQVSVICYRAVFTVLTVGLFILCTKGKSAFKIDRSTAYSYSAVGILGIGCNASGFMLSCVYLSVPQALILHYTFPLITMAGEIFITKEPPSKLQVISGFLVMVGLYTGFFYGKSSFLDGISPIGIAWGTLSVFAIAGQTLITRKISKGGASDPIIQLFYAHVSAGALLIPAKSILMGWSDLHFLTPRIFAIIHYPAIAASILGFGFLFTSLKYIPASLTSMILTLEIVVALTLTPILLHQVPTPHEIAGCAVILASVLCSILSRRKSL